GTDLRRLGVGPYAQARASLDERCGNRRSHVQCQPVRRFAVSHRHQHVAVSAPSDVSTGVWLVGLRFRAAGAGRVRWQPGNEALYHGDHAALGIPARADDQRRDRRVGHRRLCAARRSHG
nr:hypothetical protein [Tanacetum cinerariifolium]